jgi:homopolymeric O-antigen transport system ATP-binding protein
MTETAIKIENLGKCYPIRHKGKPAYNTFRDALKEPFVNLFRFRKNHANTTREDFWALKEISLEFKKGDRVGIIGRNGAGKSTLLKVLSRITEPTTGWIEIHGRVASLLEVGTGFHTELTGRENIFLNGNILGMKRKDIQRNFDEIVDFSGVEKFLDTPVKRYSSGMYMRLAFSVAAHLESDILIVDEVLAVGDAEFQKKCIGKMENLSKNQGRTVLFVSHNMGLMRNLCNKGVLLEGGEKKVEGEIGVVIEQYTKPLSTHGVFTPFQINEIDVVVSSITINAESNGLVVPYKPLRIDIELDAERHIDPIAIEITISHEDINGVVFRSNTMTTKKIDLKIKKGKNRVSCLINSFNLCSGKYWLGFGMSLLLIKYYYYELALLSFDVSEVIVEPSCLPTLSVYSHVYLEHQWEIDN